jgi:predicted nucleic acid-binding protein
VIVVDASVAIAWCLKDESSGYADTVLERVVDEGAAAPGHWSLEVANAILSAERRGRLAAEEVAGVSGLLDRLEIEIVPIGLSTAMWSVLAVAREHGLSAYDAVYLGLAQFRGVPLATLDERLRLACTSAGVELVA